MPAAAQPPAAAPVEQVEQKQPRRDRLLEIQTQAQTKWLDQKAYEVRRSLLFLYPGVHNCSYDLYIFNDVIGDP